MKIRKLSIMAGIFASALLSALAVAAHASPQVNYIDVTTTADEWNVNGTGAGCSLREAITAANENEAFGGCPTGSGSVRDYIVVPVGVYKIQIGGTDGDLMDIGKGDFDVKGDVTIQGGGSSNTILDAQGKDRIFDLDLGSHVQIQSMTLKNGEVGAGVGGAIARGAMRLFCSQWLQRIITAATPRFITRRGICRCGASWCKTTIWEMMSARAPGEFIRWAC